MVQDLAAQDIAHLKERVIELIEKNMSAIPLIAEHLDSEESVVRDLIIEAVNEGKLNGHLSPDELRFYRSDVKMPTTTGEIEEEYQMPSPPSLLIPKVIIGSGIGMFIAGQVLIRLSVMDTPMYNISTMLVFGGLVAIIAGLCSLTQVGSK